MTKPRGLGTLLVHGAAGVAPARPVVEPLVRSVTYHFDSAEESERYFHAPDEMYLYSRYENPTVRGAEQVIAESEGGEACALFGSGMACGAAIRRCRAFFSALVVHRTWVAVGDGVTFRLLMLPPHHVPTS